MPETWNINQAAQIVEKPLDVFQKVVERAPVKPKLLRRGRRQVRAFELGDLVFFHALDDLKQAFTAQKQTEIYHALIRMPDHGSLGMIEVGPLKYDFDPYVRFIRSKIEAAGKLLAQIDASGREPLIAGTSIEAYRIAALCDGMTIEEILVDYPSLNAQQVLAAKAYAESHPKAGRPYPKVTAKKSMREARVPDADEFLPSRE